MFAQEGEENDDQQQFGQEAADVADAGDDAETVDEVVNEAAADADVTVDDSTTIRAHPLTDIPPAAAGIITAVVFPDNAAKGAWDGRLTIFAVFFPPTASLFVCSLVPTTTVATRTHAAAVSVICICSMCVRMCSFCAPSCC